MRTELFYLSLMTLLGLTFPVYADELTFENCPTCRSCGENCKYILDGSKLTLYAPTQADESGSIPEGIFTSGVLPNKSQIEEVEIKGNLTTVSDLAFYQCTSLKSITLPQSIQFVGNCAFCSSGLTNVTFSDNSELKTIDARAFLNGSLSSIDFGANSKLETIGNDAFGNASLTSISIPSSVKTIGRDAFSNCTNLENLTFDENSQLESIGQNAFWRNTSLTSISLPSSLQTIGEGAFLNSALESISFGTDSELKSIGKSAFAGARNLKNIVIPASVETIGDLAFYDGNYKCPAGPVVFEGIPQTIGRAIFQGSPKIYCLTTFEACSDLSRNVQYYKKTDNGLYVLTDANDQILKDDQGNPSYFLSAELMARGKSCSTEAECEEIKTALQSGRSFLVNGKFYDSLSDWISGNYARKRIYTVEEAEKLTKPTGNQFKIRYK